MDRRPACPFGGYLRVDCEQNVRWRVTRTQELVAVMLPKMMFCAR